MEKDREENEQVIFPRVRTNIRAGAEEEIIIPPHFRPGDPEPPGSTGGG